MMTTWCANLSTTTFIKFNSHIFLPKVSLLIFLRTGWQANTRFLRVRQNKEGEVVQTFPIISDTEYPEIRSLLTELETNVAEDYTKFYNHGPSPGGKHLLELSHLRHYVKHSK